MTNRNDDTLALCEDAEVLLTGHAADDQITGRARENAQRDFARQSRPTLKLAIEKIRELVAEVAALRTGVNESEGALLRMWGETQSEVERLREKRQTPSLQEMRYSLVDGNTANEPIPVEMVDRLLDDSEALIKQAREVMVCGHPGACVVGADEGTAHCAWCEDKTRWKGLLGVAAQNAEGFRELLVESERRVAELETAVQLNAARLAQQCDLAREAEATEMTQRGLIREHEREIKTLKAEVRRATVGGGSVPR